LHSVDFFLQYTSRSEVFLLIFLGCSSALNADFSRVFRLPVPVYTGLYDHKIHNFSLLSSPPNFDAIDIGIIYSVSFLSKKCFFETATQNKIFGPLFDPALNGLANLTILF